MPPDEPLLRIRGTLSDSEGGDYVVFVYTFVYRGVATRNRRIAREILAHRTEVRPDFAF